MNFKVDKRYKSQSKYEETISGILTKHKIKFYREIYFRKFKSEGGSHYRYDFYLPDINMIIEFDGKQHRKPRIQEIDKKKNNYCWSRNINITRFTKKDMDQIEEKILKLFEINLVN